MALNLTNQKLLLCLYGKLGSGKTTFIQGFAEGLGISERILSPTFVLIRSYRFAEKRMLHHLDLYRISDMDSLPRDFVQELLDESGAIVVIEWPERVQSMLPKQRIEIFFSVESVGHRITMTHIC